jgi:uncharacterized membrane protein YfcA
MKNTTYRGTMDWQRSLVVAGAGFVAGMMNAVAGGGTMVTFPALLWAGLNTLEANITSTVALFPGMPLSAWTFRRHIGPMSSWLWKLAPVALLGGLAGGILLVQTGSRVFDFIVPWLLLLATVLFMCNGLVQRWLSRRQSATIPPGEEVKPFELKLHLWSVFILAGVAVYGGYFGAGIGIMMLATLGVLGLRDINQMNAMKVVLAMLMNVSAVTYFIIKGGVQWDLAFWLMAGSVGGYWSGSLLAQRIPAVWVRTVVILIGLAICVELFMRQWR